MVVVVVGIQKLHRKELQTVVQSCDNSKHDPPSPKDSKAANRLPTDFTVCLISEKGSVVGLVSEGG